ncbi:DUF5906 domain-containing protein [Leuconostoc mesenteroides]|uniref:DUF5906 domain-containing protein n=1 Tax=Leuconostoc mesenteroides TaxID=1245 RepID=UPI002360FB49|nr:DUF5906 domain-containing protein [Leuconostoc mesenteroides]
MAKYIGNPSVENGEILSELLDSFSLGNCFTFYKLSSENKKDKGVVEADLPMLARWATSRKGLIWIREASEKTLYVKSRIDETVRTWYVPADEREIDRMCAGITAELRQLPVKIGNGITSNLILDSDSIRETTQSKGHYTAFENGVVDYTQLMENHSGSKSEQLARVRFITDPQELGKLVLLDGMEGMDFHPEVLKPSYEANSKWLEYFEYMFGKNNKGMIQLFGNCLELNYRHNQLVHIQSVGGTGKSVFINDLVSCLGSGAVFLDSESTFDPRNTFAMQATIGSKILVDDDADSHRPNMSAVKRYTGGSSQTIARKNRSSVTVKMYGKLFIVTNENFGAIVTDSGVERRAISVKVVAKPTTKDGKRDDEAVKAIAQRFPREYMASESEEFMCYAFVENLIVNGLWDIPENNVDSLKVIDYRKEFMDEYTTRDENISNGIDLKSLYSVYTLYMTSIGARNDKTTSLNFKKWLTDKYDVEISETPAKASPNGLHGIAVRAHEDGNIKPLLGEKSSRNRLRGIIFNENAKDDFQLDMVEEPYARSFPKNTEIINRDPDDLPF